MKVIQIIKNRNSLLILALIIGLIYTDAAHIFKHFTVYILTLVMTFSVTGVATNILKDYKSLAKVTIHATILNFLIFGIVILLLAYTFFDDQNIILGFVVIAATPPGVAIIPFTYNFKGNLDYSFKAILGTYVISIILTPVIITFFAPGAELSRLTIILVILKVIVVPIIISRFLRMKKILPTVEKIRGSVVNYGFALIIYTAIALNRDEIFANFEILISVSIIIIISIFGLDFLYGFLMKKRLKPELLISHNLMFVVKSSGFAVGTSLAIGNEKTAIPASILSIFVLIYLIYKGKNKT